LQATPNDISADISSLQVNGTKSNGYEPDASAVQTLSRPVNKVDSPSTEDPTARLEAMSQERKALRLEVEQLRKALEDIQGKHSEELSAIRGKHDEDVSSIQTNHSQEVSKIKGEHSETLAEIKTKHEEEVSKIKEEHTEEISTIRTELDETESAREQAETQYQALLGRINTIKSSLGERLKADKQELAEAKEQIDELESQNEELTKKVKVLEAEAHRVEEDSKEASKELSSLRNRHNLSQQNWLGEREDLIQQTKHLREEAEAAKEAMGDWEVLAMEERSHREALTGRLRDLEEQFNTQRETLDETVQERDSQSQALEGLQRALQEVQDARKRELREMVESYEEQIQSLKKLVQQSEQRSTEAEGAKDAVQVELDRLLPFEKEVKEKNLLIGKLRHEAIVLNDHLTKALRFLKKAKPEDNIDRYVWLLLMTITFIANVL
jgi:chromosome segregation ATPase